MRTKTARGRGIEIVVRHDDDRRSNHALVRAPLPRPASSGGSTARFALVQSTSGGGERTSYVVDIFGSSVASLLGDDAAYRDVDAVQVASTLLEFYPGEVVAVRLINGDWWISKLAQTSLIDRVQAGDLAVRPRLGGQLAGLAGDGTSASLLDQGVDLATLWATYFKPDASVTLVTAIMRAGSYWLYGGWSREELFPCIAPEGAVLATIHTAYTNPTNDGLAGVGGPSLFTFFGLTPAAIDCAITWYWSTGESTVVNASSGALASTSLATASQARAYTAGAAVATPTGAHPSTFSQALTSPSVQIKMATLAELARPADLPYWVPAEGATGGTYAGLLAVLMVAGANNAWRYAPALTTNVIQTTLLPLTGEAGAGAFTNPGPTSLGSGTITAA